MSSIAKCKETFKIKALFTSRAESIISHLPRAQD